MDVGVKDLKNNLSKYLERVRRGERIRVTMRGKPVAELAPIATRASDADLRRLADQGRLTLATKPKPDKLSPPQKSVSRVSASEWVSRGREDRL